MSPSQLLLDITSFLETCQYGDIHLYVAKRSKYMYIKYGFTRGDTCFRHVYFKLVQNKRRILIFVVFAYQNVVNRRKKT